VKNKKQIYQDAASLHIASIPSGFLPTLGLKFLSLMYRCIDEGVSTILITKYRDDQLVGFVTGSVGHSNLYRSMLSHPFVLVFALFPVVFSIKKVRKIFSILNHSSSSDRASYPAPELLTICVNSSFRRQGVADELYVKLCNYFKSKSVNEFVIIVGKALDANQFYIKQGANVVGQLQVHAGADSNVFIQRVT
jgi:ribosomal protein S18 acetylase RimI-like enzyme